MSLASARGLLAQRGRRAGVAVAVPSPGSDHRDARPNIPGDRVGSGLPAEVPELSANANGTMGWRTP